MGITFEAALKLLEAPERLSLRNRFTFSACSQLNVSINSESFGCETTILQVLGGGRAWLENPSRYDMDWPNCHVNRSQFEQRFFRPYMVGRYG